MATVINLKKHFNIPFTYIGRPSKWGNPFRSGIDGTRAEAIAMYKDYLLASADLMNDLHELEGKNLGCFCKPKACHGDVLLALVNEKVCNDKYFK